MLNFNALLATVLIIGAAELLLVTAKDQHKASQYEPKAQHTRHHHHNLQHEHHHHQHHHQGQNQQHKQPHHEHHQQNPNHHDRHIGSEYLKNSLHTIDIPVTKRPPYNHRNHQSHHRPYLHKNFIQNEEYFSKDPGLTKIPHLAAQPQSPKIKVGTTQQEDVGNVDTFQQHYEHHNRQKYQHEYTLRNSNNKTFQHPPAVTPMPQNTATLPAGISHKQRNRHNHHNQHNHEHQHRNLGTAHTPNPSLQQSDSNSGREPKSIASVAHALPHNFKVNTHDRKSPRWKIDLNDDDFYDEDYNDSEHASDEANDGYSDYEEDLGNEAEDRNDYSVERSPRVPRDPTHLDYRPGTDDNYVDDEPPRSSNEHLPIGALTQQKNAELGTPHDAKQSRDRFIEEHKTPWRLAHEHRNAVLEATRCSRPLPRVVRVNITSKVYVPEATIIHRCGEDTGCCGTDKKVCVMKRDEEIQIYFFAHKINSTRDELELIKFRNHTECHCVNRTDLPSPTEDNYFARNKRSGLSRRNALSRHAAPYQAYNQRSSALSSCRCPRHYDVVEADVSRQSNATHSTTDQRGVVNPACRCDCLSQNLSCQRFKNGEEGFGMDDRKCIAEGTCKTPSCTYGEYSSHTGRCPRRYYQRTVTREDYGYG